MRCWSMNGKSAGNDVRRDALSDVPNAVNVAARIVIPIAIYQTSMKFLKDDVALETFVI